MKHRSFEMRFAWIAAALLLATACEDDGTNREQAAADTLPVASEVTPAANLPPVPAADGEVVRDAVEYEITDEKFDAFAKASESLAYLRARDASVRSLLEQPGTDSTNASVLERLEQHPQVSTAINSAGISVRDYYTMAVALAAAQRFMNNPEAAPPTPVGRKNAEWAQRNKGELAKLRTWGAAVAQ